MPALLRRYTHRSPVWQLRAAVSALLVLALLAAYYWVLATSMRAVDRTRAADASLQRERLACEYLTHPRERAACASAASRISTVLVGDDERP